MKPGAAEAERQLKSFIDKFEPGHQKLIRATGRRSLIIRSISAKQRPRRGTVR